MPQRHDSGSSSGSSSSSGGSSWHSSSSSSSWSSSSHRYDNNGEPPSPEQQVLGWIVLGVMALILAGMWISDQVKKSNQRDEDRKATQTIIAVTQKDLEEMHQALDSRLPGWTAVKDQAVHRVSGSEAGFAADSNTKEVDYGYCQPDKFYVYVVEESRPGGITLADSEGYAYTPDSYPGGCHPDGWRIVKDDNVGSGWHFVTIYTYSATSAARGTVTPYPTPAPPTATPTPNMQ